MIRFKHLLFCLSILCSIHILTAQNIGSSRIVTNPVSNEEAFLQINSSLFFVGEYLYYKMYLKNTANNKLSTLSKIGYVELIGEEGKTIFKQQLVLENGLGQGDFFIPTDVASGNFKIICYTQNMLAHSSTNFFQQDVSIINPYRGNQTAIATIQDEDNSINIELSESSFSQENNELIVNLDKNNFGKRSEVNLKLSTNNLQVANGSYSISIRRKDEIIVPVLKSSKYYQTKTASDEVIDGVESTFILPELRGKLISGKIESKKPITSVKGKKVTLSIPGEDYVFKVSDVSENGNFYFNIDKPHSQNNALFQVIGDTDNNYEIKLDSLPSINKENLEFNKFTISPKMEKMIVERSVNNQVENAFYRVKPDTIKSKPLEKAYYGKTFTTYVLDDYTRFPTMKETMVEIVDNAWVQTNSEGSSKFMVRELEGYGRTNNPLLLLVDGVFLQSHDLLANFKAAKVESISILRDRYYLGSQVFQGVMIVQTKENDFNTFVNEDYILQTQLLPNEPQKSYFTQQYDTINLSETNHIPDYRRQLLWQPNLILKEGKSEIKFFTSDIPGEFEIRIEGFKADGSPVSILKSFVVE